MNDNQGSPPRPIVRIIAIAYLAAGLIALMLVPASLHGWFGVAEDPLSGVFALLLGLPWTLLLWFSDNGGTWLALGVAGGGILLNFWLLWRLAHRGSRHQ